MLVAFSRRSGFISAWIALGLTLGATVARAQPSAVYPEGYFDNQRCLPPCNCAQGPLQGRLFGSYTLSLVSIGDVFDMYSIENVQFTAQTATGIVGISGSGTYRHSPLANLQHMQLEVFIGNAVGPILLESDYEPLEVELPSIHIDLFNAETPCTTYALRFVGGQASPCSGDLDDGSGLGVLDQAVDINDLLYFLVKFEAGEVSADMFGGPCACPDCFCPDGAVDISDLLFFLRRFEAGC